VQQFTNFLRFRNSSWNIVADSRTSLLFINSLIFVALTATESKARWAPQA